MAPTREQILGQYRTAILDGIARTLWVTAYASWNTQLEHDDERREDQGLKYGQKVNWDTVTPETPKAAKKAAEALAEIYEKGQEQSGAEGDLVELYSNAQSAFFADDAEFKHGFDLDIDNSNRGRLQTMWKVDEAEIFGHNLAEIALGESAYHLFPDWEEQQIAKWRQAVRARPTFQIAFDGEDLVWSGGLQDVREVSHKLGHITIVNQGDELWTKHRYVMSFGGFTQANRDLLLIYANGIDDALDSLIDFVAEEHPDSLADEQVLEAYNERIAEGASEDDAIEQSELDTTRGGNHGNLIHSEDWGIVAEDPSDQELNDIAFGEGVRKVNPSRKRRSGRG
jgi:hypothetical protein